MDTRQLSRIDLNLLVALQVLVEECNVSKAADRLFITQSAMSKTLGRLRELFDDPLFTRSSHGMVPTPRALDIQKKLTVLLHGVQELVADQQFDPWTYRGEFKVAIPEYIGMAILPSLLEELQQEAPHIRIVAISRIEQQLEQMAHGDLDFAIHVKHASYGSDFTVDPVASMPPVLLVRQGHPLRISKRELKTLDDLRYVVDNYPQVGWYVPDMEELDFVQRGLDQQGGGRRTRMPGEVVFETSHMFSAIEVIKRTNCVLFGPPLITRHPLLGVGVTSMRLPVREEYYFHYVLAMHKRLEASPVHQWLREKMLAIVHRAESEKESGDPYADYKVGREIGFYGPNRMP
ncbi:LysR family transcriptional regulator [Gilvimarinus sp. F26214L]|uniref:LysR family transcriptional regulator n=1 Tax=Gilvimarinus sp. DZF01 TaxID=3461371 RepID=UPI004045B0E2